MVTTSAQQLEQVIHGRWLGRPEHAVAAQSWRRGRVVIDSRQVVPGDLFWALPGKHTDGARFASEAFSRGAVGVVTHSPSVQPAHGRFVLQVDNALAALWRLAKWRRQQFNGALVAVTGSVGKTTTRDLIHTVLSSSRHGVCSPANYNNDLGVPLSLLQIEPEHDYAIIELGASAPGEIAALAELCRPTVGVLTRIADAHLAGFGGPEGVVQAKAELIDSIGPSGLLVVDDANPAIHAHLDKNGPPIVRVGNDAQRGLSASHVRHDRGMLHFHVENQPFRLPVWGRHWTAAALSAVAVGWHLDLDWHDMRLALSEFKSPPRRCQMHPWQGTTLIDDTYNACPTSMRAALQLLNEIATPRRRIAVLGEMAELGEWSYREHLRLGEEVVRTAGADVLLAYGDFAHEMVRGACDAGMPRGRAAAFQSKSEIVDTLKRHARTGDTVLVKGSRKTAMDAVVDQLVMGLSSNARTRTTRRRVIRRHKTIGVPSTVPSLRELGTTLPPG